MSRQIAGPHPCPKNCPCNTIRFSLNSALLEITRKFKEEFPQCTEAPFFMPGLRSILSPLFLAVIAVAPQNALFALPTSLVNSSVKLRVDADNGHSWGTGTIIDTRRGPEGQEALILTCGHIFRESKGQGNIEVHLFGDNSTVRVLGTCLYYDLEIDLAFVVIAPPCPVRAVPIAPDSYRIQPSQQAWSVGCDHGANPTVRQHQVLSIDRIGTSKTNSVPFHYIQVSGAPVGGRSGGGLFCAEGYLIGVCNTADPVVNDGHFVPPHIIRYVLDRMDLAHVYQQPSLGEPQAPQTLAALAPLTTLEPVAQPAVPMAAVSMPMPMYAENKAGMSLAEQATLEEIERRKQDGDEVIVIFRSRRNPEIPSDVVVLKGTSDQFLDALVKNPSASSLNNPAYNPVILSSQELEQPARQAVTFPVRY